MEAEASQASQEVLAYYRQRISAFETERDDLLKRIAVCSTTASESHSLRCEAQKRAEEVRDLQQALSAAHVHLFEERDRLLRLQAENDELKLRDAEQNQRIQHLLALTEPLDQEVKLVRSEDPSTGMLYPRHLPTEGRRAAGEPQSAPVPSSNCYNAHQVVCPCPGAASHACILDRW
jgi:coiled-coil domain-containing protein 77